MTVVGAMLAMAPFFSLGDEALRDPTRPYTVAAARAVTKPRFKVHAIIVAAERRIAIVNGRRVGVGGQVDGATVVAIAGDELVLDFEGERITARLNGPATRK